MTDQPENFKGVKRSRVSPHAFKVAVEGLVAAGVHIQKVSVNGGQIEIHCGSPESDEGEVGGDGLTRAQRKAYGLKAW